MRGASPTLRLGVLPALLLAGCAHEADATPGAAAVPAASSSAAVAAPEAAPNGAPAAVDLGDAGAPAAATSAEAGAASPAPIVVSAPDMSAAPAYPASALYETFSSASARAKLIACYTPGKQRDPKLRGKVIVKFTINQNGMAKPAANEGSNLEDDAVIACVVRAVKTFHFQKPLEGTVTVVYPFIFRPTGDETLILPDIGKK